MSSSSHRPEAIERMAHRVTQGSGTLSPQTRTALFRGDGAPPEAEALVNHVRSSSSAVSDEDLERLVEAGWTEDHIYEAIVATALGEGLRRRSLARRAVLPGRDD